MESGINADQNFYSRRPLSASPDQHNQHNHHHRHRHQHQHLPRTYEPPSLPPFEPVSPQLPPKLAFLTTQNLHAVTASPDTNGSFAARLTGGGDRDSVEGYYRGVSRPTDCSYADTNDLEMATAASESRPGPSSLRSNGNGTTPKHPHLPPARAAPIPSQRSASSPLDDRGLANVRSASALNGYPKGRQGSVKDLLKKFDQSDGQAGPSPTRTPGRINTRDSGGPGYMKERVAYQARPASSQNTTTSPSSSRAGPAIRNLGTGSKTSLPTATRPTQRTRFAPEDQHSSNTLAGAPRATRSRASLAGPNSSKSMTNLSPTSPPTSRSHERQTRRPLFGEVLEQGTPDVAYGIPRSATRRTSESSLHPSWSGIGHRRSRSDLDVSPSSPTAWYLGVTPQLDDVIPNKPARPVPGHNRNHSDFADTKVNTMKGIGPSFRTSDSPSPSTTTTTTVPVPSRLPMPSKRLSNSSDSSSLPSTRANSPFAKAVQNGKLRKPERKQWDASGRAVTPTSRAKPSTVPRSSPRGTKAKNQGKATSNHASLTAYISAPPPKSSPPLRSSRPRQTVSSASTTAAPTVSSRQRAADKSGSPNRVRTGMKVTRHNGDASGGKERKISDLPLNQVDFGARRELIRRAYTKSLEETEQRKVRADNARRLKERQQKKERESQSRGIEEARAESAAAEPAAPAESEPSHVEPLHVATSFQQAVPVDQDSPTLGIPGSFVDEEEDVPQSAVTDIDNEPQTEAPRLNKMTSQPNGFSSRIDYLDDFMSPQQAIFGIQHADDESISINIMLDSTSAEEQHPGHQHTPTTNDVFARDPSPPGAFEQTPDMAEEEAPVFASTVTIVGPRETTPVLSRPSTSLESGDEHLPVHEVESSTSDESSVPDERGSDPEVYTPDAPTSRDFAAEDDNTQRLQLPDLHTALAPQSDTASEYGQDYPHTPVTDMEYESSDGVDPAAGGSPDNYPLTLDSPSLSEHTPPRDPHYLSTQSIQSNWTDYSVATSGYSEQEDHSHVRITASPDDIERRPTPPPKEFSPVVPPKPEGYSPQPSPRFANSNHLSTQGVHQLPLLPTGDGLGLGFTTTSTDLSHNTALSNPRWPEYSPPPPPPLESEPLPAPPSRTPPPPSLYNRRPPSSLYQSSINGTGFASQSRRASDDVYSPRPSLSTPRSSTQISFDDGAQEPANAAKAPPTVPETEEEREAAEKNRKRLFQRRMVIKELIDTESVYLKDMNVVEEIYKGTAEACPKLDENDIKAIFRNTNKIVAFSQTLLDEMKAGCSTIYSPRSQRSRQSRATTTTSNTVASSEDRLSIAATLTEESDEQKDRKTFIGAAFGKHLKVMQTIYTDFLKNSELANTRLTALQTDPAVKVWLGECNLVAKDLTAAWDLDALLVKPVQRITRYQLLLTQIKENTPADHPDFEALQVARTELSNLLQDIDDLKKRIHMVGKIVGRKRKESDVRSGLAKAFGRRAEKLHSNPNRPRDDEAYLKMHEKFGDDFLRLQVVLRDVEYYTREITTWTNKLLQYLSSVELTMRLGASSFPEIESKWVRFNLSMRDMGAVALEDHIAAVRKQVIEPYERVIQMYTPPGLAIKKRNKRRLDFEKSLVLKSQGKKIDDKLTDLVAQYEALNETLKIELPKLSSLTATIGHICLARLVHCQTEWYRLWTVKLSTVLEESQIPKDAQDILDMFARDYKYSEARIMELGIVNGNFGSGPMTRASSSTHEDETRKGRPSNLSSRSRGLSLSSDKSPSLPTPDFAKRLSGQFTFSPIVSNAPGLPQYAQPQQPWSTGHSRAGSGSPATPDTSSSSRQPPSVMRPSTSRSHTSETPPSMVRQSSDYNTQHRRESGSTYNSHHVDGPLYSSRPYSGLFHSAMPLPDGPEDSQRSSRASSRDRNFSGGYNVLYLAASLFEFNISATKSEAGYPYLTYQAGEIFDVIGEKGELWLAKNQDDPSDQVGWIWSKHFARLATD